MFVGKWPFLKIRWPFFRPPIISAISTIDNYLLSSLGLAEKMAVSQKILNPYSDSLYIPVFLYIFPQYLPFYLFFSSSKKSIQ
jgi:hypothetical protein